MKTVFRRSWSLCNSVDHFLLIRLMLIMCFPGLIFYFFYLFYYYVFPIVLSFVLLCLFYYSICSILFILLRLFYNFNRTRLNWQDRKTSPERIWRRLSQDLSYKVHAVVSRFDGEKAGHGNEAGLCRKWREGCRTSHDWSWLWRDATGSTLYL